MRRNEMMIVEMTTSFSLFASRNFDTLKGRLFSLSKYYSKFILMNLWLVKLVIDSKPIWEQTVSLLIGPIYPSRPRRQ